jgi:hypothetical protein
VLHRSIEVVLDVAAVALRDGLGSHRGAPRNAKAWNSASSRDMQRLALSITR